MLQGELRGRRTYCGESLIKGALQRQWLCTEICGSRVIQMARERRKTSRQGYQSDRVLQKRINRPSEEKQESAVDREAVQAVRV